MPQPQLSPTRGSQDSDSESELVEGPTLAQPSPPPEVPIELSLPGTLQHLDTDVDNIPDTHTDISVEAPPTQTMGTQLRRSQRRRRLPTYLSDYELDSDLN